MRRVGRKAWRRVLHVCVIVGLAALLTGCYLPSGDWAQRGSLPSLHHLEWGCDYYGHPLWSPDGRWIALLAGPDFATSHLVVLTPDGRTHYDLNAWDCGDRKGL
jgi:hypothetical protein